MNDVPTRLLDLPPAPSRTSLEQLDTLVRVTTIQSWAYLATLFLVCVAALTFAVCYTVPTKVNGEGILLIEDDRLTRCEPRRPGGS